jgi:hypothetical protein
MTLLWCIDMIDLSKKQSEAFCEQALQAAIMTRAW